MSTKPIPSRRKEFYSPNEPRVANIANQSVTIRGGVPIRATAATWIIQSATTMIAAIPPA
jgi:hypothetical protein